MNVNYQKSRDLMVENQLRPNKIKDFKILNLFKSMPKEIFLTDKGNELTYSDLDINLSSNRGYVKNLHIAQLINYADISKKDKILHLGALTGYVTSLLANLCKEVVAVENEANFRNLLENNLNTLDLTNVKIVDGSLIKGYDQESPYDIIFIDTPIVNLDDSLLDQLNNNSGKILMIKKENENLSKAIKITMNKGNLSSQYLFDVFSKYELFIEKERFKF